MSHRIEHYKRVVTLAVRAGDHPQHFPNIVEDAVMNFTIFISSGSDNNVYPKSFDWEVESIDTSSFHEWHGEIQLPSRLWLGAHAADGGMIKPWGKDVTGIGYIKAWKQAAKDRFSMLDAQGHLLWRPSVSVWHCKFDNDPEHQHDAGDINTLGADIFSPRYKHLRPELHAAFKRLFPEPLKGSRSCTTICTLDQMLDAINLRINREHLPCSFHITDSERCDFLIQKPTARTMTTSELVAA